MLITLYGVNNIGKTTHTKRLVRKLRDEGYEVERVKYPVYDIEPTGSFLNKVLRSGEGQQMSEEQLQLWFVLNRFQFEPQIQKWLDEGKIVVAEDYIGTGIAWGTTKGVDTEWLEALNSKLIQADVEILMDGERTTKAIESGHLHEEDHDLIARSRAVHLELGERYGWKKVALQDRKADTFALIWEQVAPHLPS